MTPNSVKPSCLIINKRNVYIDESNGNKYLTLVPTDKRKDTLKRYEEIWSNFIDLITSISNRLHNSKVDKSHNYHENIWKSNLIQMLIYL